MKIFREKTAYSAVERTVELVKQQKLDLDNQIYVFCESRSSLSYELALAKACGGMFNVQVLSFARYISLNLNVENYLSRASATLIVRRIIEENQENLVRLKKGSAALAESVYNLISGLKSAKISPEALNEVMQNEKGALKSKIADIAFIYDKYEKLIKECKYTDESSYLTKMPELLRKDNSIRSATVIISGISNLTRQIVDIIIALEKLSNLTFVTVSYDSIAYTNEIYNKLLTLFNDIEVYDSKPLDELHQAICDRLFDPMAMKKAPLYSDKVHIFEYADIESEAEAVARTIRQKVVENGLRYKDFSIACENVEAFAPIYEKVFEEYEIPLYADRKKSLSMHPLVKLFTQFLQLRKLTYKPDIALEIAKNPLAFSKIDGDEFESYLFANTPSRKMILRPFNNLIAESVRTAIIEPAKKIPLKSTVNGYIAVLTEIFNTLGVNERLEVLGDKLLEIKEKDTAEFSRQAKNAFENILQEAGALVGNLPCDIEFFKSLILSAVESTEISLVASYSDNVFLGDMVSVKQSKSKVLFAIGLDNSVPSFKADTALLCDRELIKLDGYKCIIEPKLKVVNMRERENVLTTLLSFGSELYLSYARCDLKGKEIARSEIIDYFRAFVKKGEESPEDKKRANLDDAQEEKFTDFLSRKAGAKSYLLNREAFSQRRLKSLQLSKAFLVNLAKSDSELTNSLEDGEKEEQKIFNEKLSYDGGISATLIETYFSCPYKAFGERILKLEQLSTGDTASYEVGLIFHSVFEHFVTEVSKGLKACDVDDTAVKIFEQVKSDEAYSRYLNKRKYEHIFKLMKDEVVKACHQIYIDIENSDFKPMGTEINFADYKGAPFRAIEIPTKYGVKKINGFIDRVDRYKDYVKIVDYKTGSAEDKASAEKLYSGNSIQLYLYMNALKAKNLKLAAAHYFMISDAYSEGGDSNGFFGNTLADKSIIEHFEKLTEGEKSKYAIDFTKAGEFSKYSHVLSEREFNGFVDYAKKVTVSGTEEMYNGLFVPSPYKEKSCEYCQLKGMCGYDVEAGNRTRSLPAISKEDILNAMVEEDTNGGN